MFQIAGFYYIPFMLHYIFTQNLFFICNILETFTAGTVVLNIFFCIRFSLLRVTVYLIIHLQITASGQVVWMQLSRLHGFCCFVELDAIALHMTEHGSIPSPCAHFISSGFIYSRVNTSNSDPFLPSRRGVLLLLPTKLVKFPLFEIQIYFYEASTFHFAGS